MRAIATLALCVPLLTSCFHVGSGARSKRVYDVVILGGRVTDPESGLDGIRNVAVHGGRIVAVTAEAVAGRDTIDARSHVVAPGFIDVHSHAVDSAAYHRGVPIRDRYG